MVVDYITCILFACMAHLGQQLTKNISFACHSHVFFYLFASQFTWSILDITTTVSAKQQARSCLPLALGIPKIMVFRCLYKSTVLLGSTPKLVSAVLAVLVRSWAGERSWYLLHFCVYDHILRNLKTSISLTVLGQLPPNRVPSIFDSRERLWDGRLSFHMYGFACMAHSGQHQIKKISFACHSHVLGLGFFFY